MKKFNLAEWSLQHKQLVYFFVAIIFIWGGVSYFNLGRAEDPEFVIRQMVVSVYWPGASARQVEEQITDKIEKKLQNTPGLDFIKSYSRPGQAVVFVQLGPKLPVSQVRPTWLEVRNMVGDIQHTLPPEAVGPFFNDRFDDVFGSVYAITSDGFSYEEMREWAQRIRQVLFDVDNVKKVDLLGVQTEKIYIEIENSKLAQLGISPNLIAATIKAQNTMMPAGMIDTQTDNVYLRITGMFDDVDSVRNLPIRTSDRTFRLGDIAKVERGYADPMEPKMYFNGQPAVGIILSMEKGGNILNLGKDLDDTLHKIQNEMPKGLEIHQVFDQPTVVKNSINEFIKTLIEAIVIVLIVCFISLGFRSGMVVALCIPLIMAGTFLTMKLTGIDLHKVSLGALIIALTLLVDDAIIVIEMMEVKLEEGWERTKAASYAFSVTAFPILTGTLITCAGFMPVAFSNGLASEFVVTLFWVVTIALVLSWIAAGTVTPILGYHLTKAKAKKEGKNGPYDAPFYRLFRQTLVWCLNRRYLVIGLTTLAFVGSVFLTKFIKSDFFPTSVRPEIIVELNLPEGSSIQATEREMLKFTEAIKNEPGIANYSSYVGQGAPRFVLTAEPIMPRDNYAQVVVVAKDLESRNRVYNKIQDVLANQLESVNGHAKFLPLGPAYAYPVMFRVSGYDHDKVREIAEQIRTEMKKNPQVGAVSFDWHGKNKVMRLEVDSEKARALGVDRQTLAGLLQAQISGLTLSEYREGDKTVPLVLRLKQEDRKDLTNIKDIAIQINGKAVPLDQIAKISYEGEEGMIWRRDLRPTITVQAEIAPGVTGNDVTKAISRDLKPLQNQLPFGYSIQVGGQLEDSQKTIGYLLEPIPMMAVIIMVLLMFQLQSIAQMLLVMLTAPMGFIGVSIALLLTNSPMNFVAQLGVLSLCGMIIRNSVVLIDQINQHIAQGEAPWDAIIDSAILRCRPIMLTAAAAILGMVPLIFTDFWGPMAISIAGGLLGATALTLLVLPAMYAAWFKVCEK
ncbi:multidrug transporter AcrB [Anaerosporomusa subterranea]|uniref:Multidrug transporter AcrB n=1 Tax=Anaerosporomusa subterranea TaxID=1794912 RepID=A0A154BUR9_ANASB|nr:efflux RND transporter permease subunit [Anaerosporomusa subterranea]KYZ77681.1 multidrug transporter AcrB [Anaerosporomusa subterranea]